MSEVTRIKLETTAGVITASDHSYDDYPGIAIEVDGYKAAVVEVKGKDEEIQIRTYTKESDEPVSTYPWSEKSAVLVKAHGVVLPNKVNQDDLTEAWLQAEELQQDLEMLTAEDFALSREAMLVRASKIMALLAPYTPDDLSDRDAE